MRNYKESGGWLYLTIGVMWVIIAFYNDDNIALILSAVWILISQVARISNGLEAASKHEERNDK